MKLPAFFATAFVAAAFVLSVTSTAHAQSTFPDVPDNHWAAAAVARLAALGILEGFPTAPPRFYQSQKLPKTPVAEAKAAAKSAKR